MLQLMQQMIKLSDRQKKILEYILRNNEAKISEILGFFNENNTPISRFSIVRDLNILLENDLVERLGGGRSVKYKGKLGSTYHKYVDIDDYFKVPQDERPLASEYFDFKIFEKIEKIFSKENIEKIDELNLKYRNNLKKIPASIKKLELERFTVELSWKSSQIEGNTYTLLDTEYLIKNKIEASGHKREEAIMILNHKKALDFINKNSSYLKILSIKKIEELHRLIVGDLDIHYNLRKFPVGIMGTNYKPLDNEYQIKEAVLKMIDFINNSKHPAFKAFLALVLISYIQPFEDGNKRTGRLLSNALLLAYKYSPLSYRSVKESDYKKAILVFYETHNIDPLKRIFLEQFEFAVNNYFRS